MYACMVMYIRSHFGSQVLNSEMTLEMPLVPQPLPAYSDAEVDNMFGPREDAYFKIPARGHEFWDGIRSLEVGMRVDNKGALRRAMSRSTSCSNKD